MRSILRVAAVAVGLSALSACSLLFGPESLRAGSGDAAPDSQTASTDATVDGRLARESGSPCSAAPSTAVFCCDFDDGGICGLDFVDNSGTVGVAMDGGLSEPGALRSAAPASSGSSSSTGSFARGVASGSFGTVRLRFALLVEQRGTAKSKIAEVTFVSGSRESSISLELLSSGDFDLEAYTEPPGDAGPGYTKVSGSTVPAPVGEWLAIDISVNPTARTATFVVAGNTVVQQAPLPSAFVSGGPRFEVGFHYLGSPSGARAARFDDVTFELLP